jgi:hypothetical protein
MVHEVQAVDLEAITAIDQRRLLCVLGRAIDEEAAHMDGEDCSGEGRGNRTRLRVFCTVMSMIRETSDSGPGSRAPGSGRKGSRSV